MGEEMPGMLARTRRSSSIFGLLNLLVSALLTTAVMSLAAQTLEIKLVDGRNGRPVVGASSYVNVWVGGARKEAIAIPMDGNGAAQLQLTLDPSEVNLPDSTGRGTIVANYAVVPYDESFRINVPFVMCGAVAGKASWLQSQKFSTKEVFERGYVSANTCGRVTVLPQPGHLVLFVRPLTFWEKLRQ